MKNYRYLFIAFLIVPFLVLSQTQEKDSVIDKPERAAFESSYIIDMATDVMPTKKTLEIQMGHRFGLVDGGTNDLIGFWAPSNIRIGLTYSVHDRVTIGYGTTKFDRLQDFNWKVGILKQTRSDKIPVNVSYFGNFTIDARPKENFRNLEDRYSNFHQLIISRRFNPDLSLQIAPSISHYNVVTEPMKNDVFAISAGGRYKVSPQTAIIMEYTHPFTNYDNDPEAGFGLGVEFRTSSHAFQLFISSYQGIVPQKNIMFNQNDFFDGDFLIGFNITRLYNF
jgi:hypothetical protein